MGDDDKTPVIDDDIRLARRASEIDWSKHETDNQVQCMYQHPSYHSPAKFDLRTSAIIAMRPCPRCGTHHMSRMSVPSAYTETFTERRSRSEPVTIAPTDVSALPKIFDTTDDTED